MIVAAFLWKRKRKNRNIFVGKKEIMADVVENKAKKF